jgi:hypothetical protein
VRSVAAILDVDIVDLPASAGLRVRVGGLITAVTAQTLLLDDGTGPATVEVSGDAIAVLPQLRSGLAVNVIGAAAAGPDLRLAVSAAQDVIPVADLGAGSSGSPATSGFASPALGALMSPGADGFSLSDSDAPADASTGEAPAPAAVLVVVGLLLSLALVGVVALLLGRRAPARLMAHPLPGSRRSP